MPGNLLKSLYWAKPFKVLEKHNFKKNCIDIQINFKKSSQYPRTNLKKCICQKEFNGLIWKMKNNSLNNCQLKDTIKMITPEEPKSPEETI